MIKRLLRTLLGLVVLSLSTAQPGHAQTGGLKTPEKALDALRGGQLTIQRELQDIKDPLRGRQTLPQPEGPVLSVGDDPFKGDKRARVTLIEFSDYQCPFCAVYARETLPRIEREYIATGKVKYVFRNFPIESIHKQAFKAHEAANCAGEQGKYWEMHDRLFANQKTLGPGDLPQHARALGIDLPTFQQCLDSGKYAGKIRKDLADAQAAGVRGTPTFFLGLTEPNEPKVKILGVIVGAQPYATFKEAIDSLLATQKP